MRISELRPYHWGIIALVAYTGINHSRLQTVSRSDTAAIAVGDNDMVTSPRAHLKHGDRLGAGSRSRKTIASGPILSRSTACRVVQAGDAAVIGSVGGVIGNIVEISTTIDWSAVDCGLLIRRSACGVVGGVWGLDVDGSCGRLGHYDLVSWRARVSFRSLLTRAC